MNRRLYLTFAVLALLLGAPAHGAKRKLVTNLETVEGALLKHLLDEPDAAGKIALMESFASKYPVHESTTWILGELQTAYFKASQFDRAIGAGVAILSKDPDDIIIANANLKAAEGAGNPTLIRQWAISASMTARRLITAFRPADPEGAATWQADVDYSKQVETYCDYAIYALALQAGDLTQRVELADLLKRHSPDSPYIALLRQQLFIAFQQAGHHARALALAEEDIKTTANNEDMLLYAASKAYERQEKSKVTIYARRLLDTLPAKPAPPGINEPDWARNKAMKLGLAHWMLGMIASNEHRWPDADAHLRAALPNIGYQKGIAAEALYHLGMANHRIGDARNDKNRIIESIRFNQQCAMLAGSFQAQAKQNVVSLRSQYHIQ